MRRQQEVDRSWRQRAVTRGMLAWSCTALASVVMVGGLEPAQGRDATSAPPADTAPTLEETRLTMGKWIETQQIISRERKDWQQGKDILASRLDLIQKEISTLEEKIKEAQTSVAEADRKRNELLAERDALQATGSQLTAAATEMEGDVRTLFAALPEPIQAKLQPLFQRIPNDPSNTSASPAERFQNVLGILNEVNTANTEIIVNYEIRNLANGKPSEVRAMYVGLAQAYYVSAGGEAGIGRPAADGWQWESSTILGNDVLMALDILQGKHTPAFVPLPMKLQ